MPDCDQDIRLPDGVDWRRWVERWDRMQERYLLRRRERFDVLAGAVRAARGRAGRVVDLGCGTGTLSEWMVTRAGAEEVLGIDLDERLLALARERLRPHGRRIRLFQRDLRDPAWRDCLPGPADAVVSATTLHWLSADQLARLYADVRDVLAGGGIFLNADHVSCEIAGVQAARDAARNERIAAAGREGVEGWDAFWAAYNARLGLDGEAFNGRVFGAWEGVEEGMPLSWHFAQLQAAGFVGCECFWRYGTDAVYGAVRPGDRPDAETPGRGERAGR
jgi:SAM-dependent methyltransferase